MCLLIVIMYAGLRAVRMALLPAAAVLMLAVQVEEAGPARLGGCRPKVLSKYRGEMEFSPAV